MYQAEQGPHDPLTDLQREALSMARERNTAELLKEREAAAPVESAQEESETGHGWFTALGDWFKQHLLGS